MTNIVSSIPEHDNREKFGDTIAEMARLLRHLADRADTAAGLGYFPVEVHAQLSSALEYLIAVEDLLWSCQIVEFSHARMPAYVPAYITKPIAVAALPPHPMPFAPRELLTFVIPGWGETK